MSTEILVVHTSQHLREMMMTLDMQGIQQRYTLPFWFSKKNCLID